MNYTAEEISKELIPKQMEAITALMDEMLVSASPSCSIYFQGQLHKDIIEKLEDEGFEVTPIHKNYTSDGRAIGKPEGYDISCANVVLSRDEKANLGLPVKEITEGTERTEE